MRTPRVLEREAGIHYKLSQFGGDGDGNNQNKRLRQTSRIREYRYLLAGLLLQTPEMFLENAYSHCRCWVLWRSHLDSSIQPEGSYGSLPSSLSSDVALYNQQELSSCLCDLRLLVTAFFSPARVKKETRPSLRPLLLLAGLC